MQLMQPMFLTGLAGQERISILISVAKHPLLRVCCRAQMAGMVAAGGSETAVA
jgi:hypothetical protein